MPRRLTFTRLRHSDQPLLYVCVFFSIGLLIGSYRQGLGGFWLFPAFAAWAISLICLVIRRMYWRLSRLILWVSLICFWAGSAACGAWLWGFHENRREGAALRAMISSEAWNWDAPVEICGVLDAEPEPAPDRVYLSLSLVSLSRFRIEHRIDGSVRMVVPLPDGQAEREFASLGLKYGTRLRLLGHLRNRSVYRNPGSIDLEALLERQGYDAGGAVKSPLLIDPLGDGDRKLILSALYRLRLQALSVLLEKLRQPSRGILAAALLGNRYFLTKRTGELFRDGGTYHLLVISGLHIGVIAGVVLWLAGAVVRRRGARYAVTIGVIWAYAAMVGAQPAVSRAAVMLTIVLLGRLIFRESAGANSVAASAIILLAWKPADLFNPAFQLSLMTVFVIVVLIVPFHERLRQIGRWQPTALTPYPPDVPNHISRICEILFWDEAAFREEMLQAPVKYRLKKSRSAHLLGRLRLQKALASMVMTMLTTVGIQLGLLPLMVGLFHRFSIVAPVTNVIEGVLMLALMAGGAIFLTSHALFGHLSMPLATLVDLLGETVISLGEPLQNWRLASIRPADFGESAGWLYAAYFFGLVIFMIALNEWNPLAGCQNRRELRHRISKSVIAVTLIANTILGVALVTHPISHRYAEGRLSITFLDVGQGDAILISFPKGKLMLFDSGGRVAYRNSSSGGDMAEDFEEDRLGLAEAALLPSLWFRGIQRLDWIAASHGDADHIEAFDELIDAMRVDTAWEGKRSAGDVTENSFHRAVSSGRIPLRSVGRGDHFEVDGVHIEALWPDVAAEWGDMSGNDRSLVLRLRYGRRSFLLTGDIEAAAETHLVNQGAGLQADVLKVPHHGSKTSSTQSFLDAVSPLHAIISAGRPSPFGHPHESVLHRLRSSGVRIWETGRCGAVTASTDGDDLRLESHVRCESVGRSGESGQGSSLAR